MICIPTGRPDEVKPHGTDMVGQPVRVNAKVSISQLT